MYPPPPAPRPVQRSSLGAMVLMIISAVVLGAVGIAAVAWVSSSQSVRTLAALTVLGLPLTIVALVLAIIALCLAWNKPSTQRYWAIAVLVVAATLTLILVVAFPRVAAYLFECGITFIYSEGGIHC